VDLIFPEEITNTNIEWINIIKRKTAASSDAIEILKNTQCDAESLIIHSLKVASRLGVQVVAAGTDHGGRGRGRMGIKSTAVTYVRK
jgi:hypothetical protein